MGVWLAIGVVAVSLVLAMADGPTGAGEPFALERAIRERLIYARDGETLVRLDPAGDTTPRIP
jgi:hypothetical protein